MGDAFYKAVRFLGRHAFWLSSSPVVVGAEHVPTDGSCILAATHQSPYDVAVLITHSRRLLDFVSIVEVFRNPLVAWFYGSLNAFPLDRSRPDAKTVRIILDRLRRGRTVVMFPEGGLRRGPDSVVYSRRIRSGIGRVAHLANAPIVPCVLLETGAYSKFASWLPLRRTRYGVIYGPPLSPTQTPEMLEASLVDAFVTLNEHLSRMMERNADAIEK